MHAQSEPCTTQYVLSKPRRNPQYQSGLARYISIVKPSLGLVARVESIYDSTIRHGCSPVMSVALGLYLVVPALPREPFCFLLVHGVFSM